MPEINTKSLQKEFKLETVREEVKDLKVQLQSAKEIEEDDFYDTDEVLKGNIERANNLLDLVESEIEKGSFSASLVQAAGQLINVVTTAANSIVNHGFTSKDFEYKERQITLKEFEADIRAKERGKQGDVTNNILVTDRESLLDMLTRQNVKEEDIYEIEE